MYMKEGEQFLNEKYPDLQRSQEIESAAKRQEIRMGEKPKDKHEKVEAYLKRLSEVFSPENVEKKEQRIDILKSKLHDKLIIKEIPESYFKQQQKIVREQGHGAIEITDRLRQEALKTITADQKQSLDAWVDYLGSSDATYPDWLKYWAFRSITGLSQYDKEAHEFKKRSKGTTAPFPDINREALAYVLDAVEKQQKKKVEKKGKKEVNEEIPQVADQQWEKLLKNQNFAKLYAHAIEKITPASEEEKEKIEGEWIKYDRNSDAKPLYESLQGHGTGWCTAGESTAEAQLKMGDFYVFYTKNQSGLNKIPRVAIRMQEGEIAEVRGINADQNLEPAMVDIAKEKYSTLPGGGKYEKRSSDMKRLTEIENKLNIKNKFDLAIEEYKVRIKYKYDYEENIQRLAGFGVVPNVYEYPEDEKKTKESMETELNKMYLKSKELDLLKEELRFLYEIDGGIEGFGYKKDPRIKEIKEKRDQRRDFAVLFNCDTENVALRDYEMSDETIVLVGDLQVVYVVYDNLKHVTGNADFSGAKVEKLGKLESIGGYANFYGSEINDLGKLQSIGGHIYIGKDSKLDFSRIKVGGRVVKGKPGEPIEYVDPPEL